MDTNVLVSGVLSARGAPAQVLERILVGGVETALDRRIVSEYVEVLGRPRLKVDPSRAERLIRDLLRQATFCQPAALAVTLPDPDDLPFLEVAVAVRADRLVTGNLRHFPPEKRYGVTVVTPRQFMEELEGRSPAQ